MASRNSKSSSGTSRPEPASKGVKAGSQNSSKAPSARASAGATSKRSSQGGEKKSTSKS